MTQIFGLLAGVVAIISFLPYIVDIFRGKTKPERASWFIWAVLGGIAFFSQFAKGATDSLWLPGVQTFGVALIFLLAMKFGTGGFAKRDKIALLCAALGLVLWYITSEAAIALFIVIAVDAAASVLTIIKSYEDPESETIISWVLFSVSGILAAFAVGSWNLVLLSYPFYIFLTNAVVVTTIYLGKNKKKLAHARTK